MPDPKLAPLLATLGAGLLFAPAAANAQDDANRAVRAAPPVEAAPPESDVATAEIPEIPDRPLREDVPRAAIALLAPTAGNTARATVRFTPAEGAGLQVDTVANGLPVGAHAYHFHIYGDCSADDGTSAGTHFNLAGPSLNPPGDLARITGNLGTLNADAQGHARHQSVLEDASLVGPKAIIGRAVIIHAQGNDPDQPPIGAAGSRLACGVIGIANPG